MLIMKRDGRTEEFDVNKIRNAVKKAYEQIFVPNAENIESVVRKVVYDLNDMHAEIIPITVIQSLVENRLIDMGYIHVAAAYIEYRLQHDLERYGYGDQLTAKVTIGRNK